ncbi:MAG: hypothetical protein KAT11_08365 [Phycisphaerae bacterium]|nr:hypothetical protein [Phycisphaerae bacterium]
MADYTLVIRVRLEALDDLQARQSAREMLEQMHQQEICPDAQLVLRRQGPDASRNLLTNDK